jgi:hypothetical protein
MLSPSSDIFCTEHGDSTIINPTHVMQGMENVNYPQGNQFSGPNLDPGNQHVNISYSRHAGKGECKFPTE